MKKLLFCLRFLGFYVFVNTASAQTNFTPTQLSGDFTAPNRGAQHWGTSDWGAFNATPTIPAGNTTPKNFYTRFNIQDIEPTTQGTFTWTVFDAFVNKAIDSGAMFTFGIMPICTACGSGGLLPAWLTTLMTNEGKPGPVVGGVTYPNYQSTSWKSAYSALMRAAANHIAVTSHSGHSYTSAFLGYDIRHSGDFGEGVGFSSPGTIPSSAQITTAYMTSMIDTAISAYPNVQLSIPMNYVAPNNDYTLTSGNPDAQSAWYALTKSNSYGRIGWRRDNIWDDGYNAYFTGTTATYNPGTGAVPLKPLIMNAWQVAPIGGEPFNGYCNTSRCGSIGCDFHNEDTLFHMSYFGNANYPIAINDNSSKNCALNTPQNTTNGGDSLVSHARQMSAEQGYRIVIDSGHMTTTLNSGNAFNVTLKVRNYGNAPVYEPWTVYYELRNAGGTAVWTGISRFNMKLFLPASGDSTVSDNFSMNNAIAAGTYNLRIIIRDPAGYKAPFPLAITGRQGDGSYILRSGIVISSSPATDSLTYISVPGESNSVGNAPNAGAPAAQIGTRSEIKIWNHASHVYESVNISGNNQQDGFALANTHGIEVALGNQVDSGHLPNPTYLVKYAVSGSPICQWIPSNIGTTNGSHCRSGLTGLWEGWVSVFSDDAVAGMNALTKPYRTYVFMSEGLNDQFPYFTNTDTFTVKMRLFKSLFRTRYSLSNLHFFYTNFYNPPASSFGQPWLSVYNDSLTLGDPYAHVLPVTGTTYMDGGTHWDYNGFQIIGQRLVDSILNIQGFSSGSGSTPVAYAGPNQTITLPTSSVTLDGSGSILATTYQWSQISGPNTAVFGSATSATTSATGLQQGTYVFQLSINSGVSSSQVTVTVNPPIPPGTSVFTTQTPVGTTAGPDQAGGIELGMRFQSSVSGYIVGAKFYKTSGNTGTHTGELYTNAGTRLAQYVYTNETSTGWQFVTFTTPVAITANTTYVIACFSGSGFYPAAGNNYFANPVVNSPLTGLADGTDGSNGVFSYSATPTFPTSTYQKSNYWVDAIFSATLPGQCNGCHPRNGTVKTLLRTR